MTLSVIDYPSMFAVPMSDSEKVALAAEWIWSVYDRFYDTYVELTWGAKAAFETRDHVRAVSNAKTRLGLYNATVHRLADELRSAFPSLYSNESYWVQVEDAFIPRVSALYEFDLAIAYLHSVRRRLYRGEWRAVEYDFDRPTMPDGDAEQVFQTFVCVWPVDPSTVRQILSVADLSIAFRDIDADALNVAVRLNEVLSREAGADLSAIDMVRAVFFRNRGAYLVGRMVLLNGSYRPFVLALVNDDQGLRVDALLNTAPSVHNLFSSTEAPFQVTHRRYHELCEFLLSIMPNRPLGLHYSAIGFHHVSKVAVMNEVKRVLVGGSERLSTAPGSRGTVAIAFTSNRCDYVLKVIRDRPTDGYKWDSFAGAEAVLEKYRSVHDINRTGSMLDNILYYNLKFHRSWFAPELQAELLADASNAVRQQGEWLVFGYLVVQRKLTPLNVFLKSAPEERAARAIVNLGYCIKSNAAANVFNRDFDARNYGVNRYLKVYLYDYDSIERLVDVKVRTNTERFDGEEDIPQWFFEEGVVFLPEEIEAGLRVDNRVLRRAFRDAHADLMTVAYWEQMQSLHRAGVVPGIHTYPEVYRLGDPGEALIANE